MSEAKKARRRGNTGNKNLKRFAINCYQYGTYMNKDLAEMVGNALAKVEEKVAESTAEEVDGESVEETTND